MKKILFLITAVLFLTGCEVTYTINIDDDFNEATTIIPQDDIEKSQLTQYQSKQPAYYNPDFAEDFSDNFLNVTMYNTYFTDRLVYSYKFLDSYVDSNFPNLFTQDFTAYIATNDYSYSKINAKNFSKIFNQYPKVSQLTINIVTSKEVTYHDADKVNGNVYTWIINKDNKTREINIFYIDERYYTAESQNRQYIAPNPEGDPEYDPEVDPNSGSSNPSNKQDNDNKENDKQSSSVSNKQSNIILYVLYTLFFGLIFVIIVFRKKFKR